MNNTLGMVNATVSLVLIALVIITLVDSARKWVELLQTEGPVGMNTDVPAVCQFGESKSDLPG
jgi:carbon starvation protein